MLVSNEPARCTQHVSVASFHRHDTMPSLTHSRPNVRKFITASIGPSMHIRRRASHFLTYIPGCSRRSIPAHAVSDYERILVDRDRLGTLAYETSLYMISAHLQHCFWQLRATCDIEMEGLVIITSGTTHLCAPVGLSLRFLTTTIPSLYASATLRCDLLMGLGSP